MVISVTYRHRFKWLMGGIIIVKLFWPTILETFTGWASLFYRGIEWLFFTTFGRKSRFSAPTPCFPDRLTKSRGCCSPCAKHPFNSIFTILYNHRKYMQLNYHQNPRNWTRTVSELSYHGTSKFTAIFSFVSEVNCHHFAAQHNQ